MIIRYLILLLLATLVCASSNSFAQDSTNTGLLSKKRKPKQEVEMIYNLGHIGHNLSFNYTRFLGKSGRHAITGGLKYHLETEIHNKNSAFDGWTFYREYPRYGNQGPSHNWKDLFEPIVARLGFTFGYKYMLSKNLKARSLNPFLFYQLQIQTGMPATKFPEGPRYYRTERYTSYESAFGIGIQPKLYKKLNGLAGFGFGSTRFNWYGGGFWERSINVRFGFTYPLGKTVEPI